MSPKFAEELAVFEAHRADWVPLHRGKWAVIRGNGVLGFYSEYVAAWKAADEEYGEPGFLVKQVTARDEPVIVSHLRFHAPAERPPD